MSKPILYRRKIKTGGYIWESSYGSYKYRQPVLICYRITNEDGKIVDSFLRSRSANKVYGKTHKIITIPCDLPR